MKTIKKIGLLVGVVVLTCSCSGHSTKTTTTTNDTCGVTCHCPGDKCHCGGNPCQCHIDTTSPVKVDTLTSANTLMLNYFNGKTGKNTYLKLSADAEKAICYDGHQKEITRGDLVKEKSNNKVLVYKMKNGFELNVSLVDDNLKVVAPGKTMDYKLIFPIAQTYTSKKNQLEVIYRPGESVTLLLPDSARVLKQGAASAHAATYTDSSVSWHTHGSMATLINADKSKVIYKQVGKSHLPKIQVLLK